MDKYICLESSFFFLDEFELRPITKKDIEEIRIWRNAQMTILRQEKYISTNEQLNYYRYEIAPEFKKKQPSKILFCFLENGNFIGYGGLVHISWIDRRAEMSFLLSVELMSDTFKYQARFEKFIELIKKVAFKELRLNRLFTETYDLRDFHISVLENNGFVYEGRLNQHVRINDKFVDSIIHGCLNDTI